MVLASFPIGSVTSRSKYLRNTNEGMKSINTDEYKIMTVQFHPEASPGPEETAYIFDEFLSLIRK